MCTHPSIMFSSKTKQKKNEKIFSFLHIIRIELPIKRIVKQTNVIIVAGLGCPRKCSKRFYGTFCPLKFHSFDVKSLAKRYIDSFGKLNDIMNDEIETSRRYDWRTLLAFYQSMTTYLAARVLAFAHRRIRLLIGVNHNGK